MLKKNT